MLHQVSCNSVIGRSRYKKTSSNFCGAKKRRTHRAGLRRRGMTSLEPKKKCEHAAAPTSLTQHSSNSADLVTAAPILPSHFVSLEAAAGSSLSTSSSSADSVTAAPSQPSRFHQPGLLMLCH